MSGIQEFLTAMQMLQRGMQDVAQGSIISQATADMKLAKEQIKDDQERFMALQNLSSDLAMRLSGAGADPTKVAQTMKAVAPQFGTADEAIFQGAMSGSDQLMKLGQKAKSASNAEENALKRRALDLQELDMRLRARGESARFDPTQYEAEQITNLEMLPKDVRSRVIPDIGVASDEADAKELRKYYADSKSSRSILDEIEQISATGNRLNPQTASRLNQKLTMLVGRMRKPIVGGGVMTDKDFDKILETLPDLTSWTDKFTGSQQAKLRDLKRLMQRSDEIMAESGGITFFKNRGPRAGKSAELQAAESFLQQNPNHPRAREIALAIEMMKKGQ